MRIDPPQAKTQARLSLLPPLFLLGMIVLFILTAFFYIKGIERSIPSIDYKIYYAYGDVQYNAAGESAWRSLRDGDVLSLNDKIRIGAKGEIEFGIENQSKFRAKSNTEFQINRSPFYVKNPSQQIQLRTGTVFGTIKRDYKGPQVVFDLPQHKTRVYFEKLSTFIIHSSLESAKSLSWVGVLRGRALLTGAMFKKEYEVGGLQKIELAGGAILREAEAVNREEWNQMKEAYELTQQTAEDEAVQHDLSKEAGNFFRFVIDHGTFYAPNAGRSEREFYRNEDTGEVHLEVTYDVFPENSFVGMYIKTKDLKLKGHQGIRFDAKRADGDGYPERVRIELKSKGDTVRSFQITHLEKKWNTYVFPFVMTKEIELEEMAFVFSNDRVGQFKKGVMLLRRIELITPDEKMPEQPEIQAAKENF